MERILNIIVMVKGSHLTWYPHLLSLSTATYVFYLYQREAGKREGGKSDFYLLLMLIFIY